MPTAEQDKEHVYQQLLVHRCANCNKIIKYVYYWHDEQGNDIELGKECWKELALPQVLLQREQEQEERQLEWWQQDYALVEALRAKDYSKIRSEFKLSFLRGLVEQFDDKGFITRRQKEMVRGTGAWNGKFYDMGMLNDSDNFNEAVILYAIGNDNNKQLARNYAGAWSEERENEFYSAIGVGREV